MSANRGKQCTAPKDEEVLGKNSLGRLPGSAIIELDLMAIPFRRAVLTPIGYFFSVLLLSGCGTTAMFTRSLGNQDASPEPPRLEKVGTYQGFDAWMVDGSYVRTFTDEEFTNFGQHHRFPYIPQNEFWLDRESSADEQAFFIAHLLIEERLMARGVSYALALEEADRSESMERRQSGDREKMTQSGGLVEPSNAHLELWKRLASGVSVWIVDGRLVRSAFDVDFTEGGHDLVYHFVPHNEVWIDNDLTGAERPFVLLHELHERNLMSAGWQYAGAHQEASTKEFHCRHHTDELYANLGLEGLEQRSWVVSSRRQVIGNQ
jgi:hypothetical protein